MSRRDWIAILAAIPLLILACFVRPLRKLFAKIDRWIIKSGDFLQEWSEEPQHNKQETK